MVVTYKRPVVTVKFNSSLFSIDELVDNKN